MKLWIDDERAAPKGWIRLPTFEAAKQGLEMAISNGFLEAVAFDHDLGSTDPEDNGYKLACMLEQACAEGRVRNQIECLCQSDNGPGRHKIMQTIASIERLIERNTTTHAV